MSCGLCGQSLGRLRIYDSLRRRVFCSVHCSRRYLAILALWLEILEKKGSGVFS